MRKQTEIKVRYSLQFARCLIALHLEKKLPIMEGFLVVLAGLLLALPAALASRLANTGPVMVGVISTMHTRQPPSPAVDPKNDTVSRTSSTRITVKSLPVFSLITRSSTRRSGCACAAMRFATGWSSATASDVADFTSRTDGSGCASTKRAMR